MRETTISLTDEARTVADAVRRKAPLATYIESVLWKNRRFQNTAKELNIKRPARRGPGAPPKTEVSE